MIINLISYFGFRCGGAVFEAEKLTVKDNVYHKRCFTCHRCSRALDSYTVATSPDGEIYCKVCYKIVHAYERPQFQQDMTVIMSEEEKDGCPRCAGKVNQNISTPIILNVLIIYFICDYVIFMISCN